ncbi:hypothetical protein CR513_23332, partial [Mucuna pruriens]
MILVEIGEPSLRRSSFNLAKNLSSLQTDLNLATRKCKSMVRLQDLNESNLDWRREEEKRRREAHDQLARVSMNRGITRQWRIPLGTIRCHDHPEDVEFHAPK